jgi:hypothetical protein
MSSGLTQAESYLVASLSPTPPALRSGNNSSGPAPLLWTKRTCEALSTQANIHLHYYFAIKAGKSGQLPQDPLSIALIPRAIYLAWPYQLPPDVIPTFNINLIYSPPVPGAPWQGNTFYPAGSVVTSSANKGHYYTALTGGFSDSEPGEPVFPVDKPPKFRVGTLEWMDSGATFPTVPSAAGGGGAQGSGSGQTGGAQGGGSQGGGPQGGGGQGNGGGGKAQMWFPNTHYLLGDVVYNPENGHYFTVVVSKGGFSGSKPQSQSTPDPFPTIVAPPSLSDGEVQWRITNKEATDAWKKGSYSIGASILGANKLSYVMIGSTATKGSSGGTAKFPRVPVENVQQIDNEVLWLYSPQTVAAQDWQPNHTYYLGNAVLDGNNHVYVMVGSAAGATGSIDPTVQAGFVQNTVSDGDLLWGDMGTTPPDPAPDPWFQNTSYSLGKTVSAANGHYYQVIRFQAGISGDKKPSFVILQASTLVEPRNVIPDSGVMWLDLGVIRPLSLAADEPLRWQPNTSYGPKRVIFVPGIGGGRYYQALNNGGNSGPTSPFVNLAPALPITWQDAGTVVPSSVASGQPADQNLTLINLTLPQTHALSYFNLAFGVAVDFPPACFWLRSGK